MKRITRISVHPIQKPLKTTFSTALGKKDVINSVIVKVRLDSGQNGAGEIPTSFAFREETVGAIFQVLAEIVPTLKGMPIEDYCDAVQDLRKKYPRFTMTVSGLEVALFRAWLESEHRSETEYWNRSGRSLPDSISLKTDITIPYTDQRERLAKWLNTIVRLQFTEFKIKLSGDTVADFSFVDRIDGFLRDRLAGYKIRLDGNQGYTAASFLKFMEHCSRHNFPFELVEQPLRKNDYAGLRTIRREVPMPVILDESVSTLSDLIRAMELDACDGVNVKIAKSGVSESIRIMDTVRAHELKLMIGCMTETMTGLSAAVRLAAGSGAFTFLDLDSIYFLFGSKKFSSKEFADICLDGPEYKINF